MKKISLTETELTKIIQKVIKEDAGMDTPGGNPEYFYDEDSVFAKLRNREKDNDTESMSNEDIGSLNRMIKKYSPEKILATMSILRKRPLSEQKGGDNYSKDSDDGATYSKDSEEGAIYTKEDVVDE